MLNAISFDVEDWFQVENLKETISFASWDSHELRIVENTRRILRLLEKRQTHATFFVLGWIAEKCSSLVKEIAEGEHEIASHGYGHELIYKLTPDAFHADILHSKELLQSITGKPPLGYRAPSFSITPESEWALDILKGLGFVYDSSIFPTSFHNRYGFKGASRFPFRFANGLVEMPLSTLRLCRANIPIAGGGYFRLFPYFFFRQLCRRLNAQGRAIVFYMHPWEIDPGQPRVDIRLNYRVRQYINLKRAEKRLERLLGDFTFVPLSDMVERNFPGTIQKTV